MKGVSTIKRSGVIKEKVKALYRMVYKTVLKEVEAAAIGNKISTIDLVDRIYNFCEVYSGRVLYKYQTQFAKRVIRSVLDNDGAEITALFARQSGKSETIAVVTGGLMILLPILANMPMFADDRRFMMYKDGVWIGVFAPSQRQAQITYNRMKTRLQSPQALAILNDPEFNLFFSTSNGQTVRLSNGSFATAISASDGSNIEGESFKIIICEECLLAGNKIFTENGEVPVEKVKVGDKVLSFNHNTQHLEFKEVVRAFSQPLYERKVVTITTESGKVLKCTDNHKIFIPEKNKYVRADSLQIGDLVLSKGLQEEKIVAITVEEYPEVKVYDLTVKDNHNFFAEDVLVHNCQDISNYKLGKSISPMGAAYNATTIKIGTATMYKGNFYEAIQRNKKEYQEGKLRVKNHFEYDYHVVQKYNPNYAKYIEREKKTLGENSDAFRMSYGLEWIFSRGMFIDINEFEIKCGNALMDFVERDLTTTHVVGIDVGGGGDRKTGDIDSTVLSVVEVDWNSPAIVETSYNEETGQDETYIAYDTRLVYFKKFTSPDYEEQYHEILEIFKNFKISKLVMDTTKESSMCQRIRANVRFPVEGFVFSSKSKSDLYKHFESEIETGRFNYPNSATAKECVEHKEFIHQMTDLQKSYRGSYLVVSHPPEKGAHDDYPDSVALALWAAKTPATPDETETADFNNVFGNKSFNSVRQNFYSPQQRMNRLTAMRRR